MRAEEKNSTSAPGRGRREKVGFPPSVQNMGLRPRESATRFLSLGGYDGFKSEIFRKDTCQPWIESGRLYVQSVTRVGVHSGNRSRVLPSIGSGTTQ